MVLTEFKKAKLPFGLPADAPVVACYEAGRDGFGIHRFLVHEGVRNMVVKRLYLARSVVRCPLLAAGNGAEGSPGGGLPTRFLVH
jgi:hypothetical protein